jgi:D-lactate dehydrogenase (cytochrome)
LFWGLCGPQVRCGAFIGFANLHDSATATIALVQASLATLCRCELLNADGVRATNKKYGTTLDVRPTIFLEYRSTKTSLEGCLADAAIGEEVMKKHGAKQYKFADKGEDLDRLWEARRGCYIAAISYRELKGDRVYLSDTCVPISHVAQMLSETEDDFTKAGFPCIICAHIADGNFHCCIPSQPEQQATVKEIETRMIKRALSLEGSVSGEHGVGVGKIEHVQVGVGGCACV